MIQLSHRTYFKRFYVVHSDFEASQVGISVVQRRENKMEESFCRPVSRLHDRMVQKAKNTSTHWFRQSAGMTNEQ